MSVEVGIWRVDSGLRALTLGAVDYEGRLERAIEGDISIVDPTLMVIGRQVATPGGPVDILAIEADGNLVVIELKRDRTPREVVAQILDYGSCIRHMTTEQIAELFLAYQLRSDPDATPQSIYEALRTRFGTVPEELNASHRLVVVATEMDSSTERIVNYLKEQYDVEINVAFFRAFEDEERIYLSRAWLAEPTALPEDKGSGVRRRENWNGEFYVSFGEGPHRRWSDAKKYGFIGAGGGRWYVQTLEMLQPGSRVWVNVPRRGYVGVGTVLTEVLRFDNFRINLNGTPALFSELELEAPEALDENHGEHLVSVEWIRAVEIDEAVSSSSYTCSSREIVTVLRIRTPSRAHAHILPKTRGPKLTVKLEPKPR